MSISRSSPRPPATAPPGPDPTRLVTGSLSDELDAVARQIRDWTEAEPEHRTDPATVAVLAHDRYHCERLATGLADRGVPASFVDRDSPPDDRVSVMTMHRAKGTEFVKVVLAGLGAPSTKEQARLAALDESERADVELRRRSLTYVAATRARDELAVVVREQ